MKKSLIVFAACAFLISSCKKDDNNTGSGGKTGTLTSGKWKIITSTAVIEYPQPIGNQTVNVLTTLQACQIDNLYIFNTDNTLTSDEGATKCNASDPQTKSTGTWALSDNDTHLTISDGTSTSIISDVLTLDNSTLSIRYVTYYNNITSTTTTTYTHQ